MSGFSLKMEGLSHSKQHGWKESDAGLSPWDSTATLLPGLKPFPEAETRNKHISHQLCGSQKIVSDRLRIQGSRGAFESMAEAPLNVCGKQVPVCPTHTPVPPGTPANSGHVLSPLPEQTWAEGPNLTA